MVQKGLENFILFGVPLNYEKGSVGNFYLVGMREQNPDHLAQMMNL
jgi:hypothetical protein